MRSAVRMRSDTVQSRAAIGGWTAGSVNCTSHSSSMTVSCHPAECFSLVLSYILLIGGIEQNPGPVDEGCCEHLGRLKEAEESINKLKMELDAREAQLLKSEELMRKKDVKCELLKSKNEKLLAEQKEAQETSVAVCPCVRAIQNQNRSSSVPAIEDRAGMCTPTSSKKQVGYPLHIAAQHGLLEDAKMLLDNDEVLVNQMNAFGKTPVHLAAAAGNEHMLRFLVVEGHADASFYVRDTWDTALSLAAQEGHLAVIQFLINEDTMSPLHKYEFGNTILHMAAIGGHIDVLNWLLKNTTLNIHNTNKYGETALHQAVTSGHLNTVKWLINKTVLEVSDTTIHGETAYHLAVIAGHIHIVQWMLEDGHAQYGTPNIVKDFEIHLAARGGSVSMVRWCIAKDVTQVNKVNEKEDTPLHVAVKYEHLDAVRCLVEEGQANVDTLGHKGKSTLYFAAIFEYMPILKYLVQQANVNLKLFVREALLATIEAGLYFTPMYLYEEICNTGIRFEYLKEATWNAVRAGNMDMVSYLIHVAGADIIDQHLHLALNMNNLELVKELIHSGASTAAVVDCNYCANGTAFHHAAQRGYIRTLNYMIEETGVNITAVNSNGRTPINVAISMDIKNLLLKGRLL